MIKFVFFDVGGVLIKDFSKTNKWEEMLSDLPFNPKDQKSFGELFDEYELDLCKDKSIESFRKILLENGIALPKEYDLNKDFVSRFEKNDSIWKLVSLIKAKYSTGLLTNMYPRMLDMIYEFGLFEDENWENIVDSSIVGTAKPEEKIFQIAEELSGFSGSEILFIDNSSRHLEAAKKFGWEILLYDPSDIEGSNWAIENFLELE